MPSVRTDTTRDRIVEAADACFARYGVAKTTVEDIAAAAGLSRATVYRAFTGGRDELILAVVLRDLARFLDRLAVRLAGQHSVPDGIVEGVLDAVSFVRSEPQMAQFLAPEAAGHTQAVVAGAAERVLELCCDYVRPYFDLAQRERLLRSDVDVEGAMEFLFRIISSMTVMPLHRDDAATRRFVETYVVPALVA
ncbi:TetR/AcrR family transcriptional regulator [Actinomadura scrupuli]|uniref:TetR/AcrR family transcriptional regulator n=1 Tax=Actinomadura scrupuli TaxID=559629 RepID=UPI003D978277